LTLHKGNCKANPNSEENKAIVDKTLDHLKEFEEKKIYDLNRRSRVKWLRKSHEATKEFFVTFKECGLHSLITELEDDQGQNIFLATKIDEWCRNFYVRLYAKQVTSDNNREAKEAFLSYMKDQIFVLMKRRLTTPIIKEELWFALEAMVKGKAPELDGVIVEFFLCKWPIIGKEYMKMIKNCIVNDSFPLGLTRGLIKLLHKGGEKKKLPN